LSLPCPTGRVPCPSDAYRAIHKLAVPQGRLPRDSHACRIPRSACRAARTWTAEPGKQTASCGGLPRGAQACRAAREAYRGFRRLTAPSSKPAESRGALPHPTASLTPPPEAHRAKNKRTVLHGCLPRDPQGCRVLWGASRVSRMLTFGHGKPAAFQVRATASP
jgi:hypothetical protein